MKFIAHIAKHHALQPNGRGTGLRAPWLREDGRID